MISRRFVYLLSGILFFSIVIVLAFLLPRGAESLIREIEACEAQSNSTQQCFEELIVRTAKEKDVSSGFDVLALLYDRNHEFAQYCHGNTHELGEIAYEKFAQKNVIEVSSKTSYCGFGFYHGFLESLLHSTGDLDEARRYCGEAEELLKSTYRGVPFACYHGIGHGVIDGTNPASWNDAQTFIAPGLELCATLGKIEEHKERCASGVFNALALAYRDPTFSLDIDKKDPYALCRSQKERYERESCHDQMNTYISASTQTFDEALSLAIFSAAEEYKVLAVETTAATMATRILKQSTDTFESYITSCKAVPFVYAQACIRGIASGLIELGKPEHEADVALRFCAQSDPHNDECHRVVFVGIRDRVPLSKYRSICDTTETFSGRAVTAECQKILEI